MKRTGDYADCWLEGKVINLFEEGKRREADGILREKGITVISWEGDYGQLKRAWEKQLKERGVIGRYRSLIEGLTKMRFSWEEQSGGEEFRIKYGLSKEQMEKVKDKKWQELALNYFREQPPMGREDFGRRAKEKAEKTNLRYLRLLPKTRGEEVEENILDYLEKEREHRKFLPAMVSVSKYPPIDLK